MSQNKRKTKVGVVIQDKMDKTRVVKVLQTFHHKFYNKVVRKYKKYYMHDEKNEAKAGDKVKIMETRPLSKLKRWRLEEIIKKAAQ
ncbi:MAG: 30S ribosomal protein S17 [Endomicrobiales bacterium]|nr:30S ribosomal protein S17 [Endomicrobiales bacterium]